MATGLFTLRQQNQALRQGAWSGTQKPDWVEYLVVAGGEVLFLSGLTLLT